MKQLKCVSSNSILLFMCMEEWWQCWLACREQEVTSSGQSVDAGSEVMDSSNNWEFKDGKVSKYKNLIQE